MTHRTILIVEDEVIIAREIESRLKSMGYEVLAIVSSGEDAIEAAGRLLPDLVLMDVVLKGEIDGIEAAAEIRRRNRTPVVYLTAYTDEKTLTRAKITEPFGYIVKPFSERELRANIEMALYKNDVETRLRKVERWFSGATRDVADAMISADSQGLITSINTPAEAITRWSRDQAIGRPLNQVLRIVSRSTREPLNLDGLAGGPLVRFSDNTLLLDRSDDPVPVDVTVTQVRDAEERPAGVVSLFKDATGLRRGAVASLNADVGRAMAEGITVEAMLSLVTDSLVRNLDAAFARVWLVTADTLILKSSSGMYAHLDGPHSRIQVGKFKIGEIAASRRPHLTNDVQSDPAVSDHEWARREGITAFAGYPLLVDDRLIGVMAMFSRHPLPDTILDALGSLARSVAVGVERKRLEDQLRQSHKLEAIGLLAGGVAHDFNNLLTIISGYTQFLIGMENVGGERLSLLTEINKAGERAASLTRQLLAFSRKQVLEPRSLDLNALVTDTERLLRRLIGEDIDLSLNLAPGLGTVTADPGQIEQIILNLAVNARDAMSTGGKLTIETADCVLPEGIHVDADAGDYIRLSISDNGEGMTPEVKARVFEPFFTTKETGRGTGLGLSTVYGIVKQSGGHVEVYSEPGLGTTFKIYLPRSESPTEVRRKSADTGMPKGRETILLVEDEDAVRAIARYTLRSCGYTVHEARNGLEALEILGRLEKPVDMVVTDVVMPEMSGRELMEKIRESYAEIPALFMSGYTDDAVVRHGILSVETLFLQKPFTPAALANKIREALDAAGKKAPGGS